MKYQNLPWPNSQEEAGSSAVTGGQQGPGRGVPACPALPRWHLVSLLQALAWKASCLEAKCPNSALFRVVLLREEAVSDPHTPLLWHLVMAKPRAKVPHTQRLSDGGLGLRADNAK